MSRGRRSLTYQREHVRRGGNGKLIESKLDAIVRASLRLDNFSALIENELYKAREQMSVLQYALYAVGALCLVLVLNYCAVAFYVSRIKPRGETFLFV